MGSRTGIVSRWSGSVWTTRSAVRRQRARLALVSALGAAALLLAPPAPAQIEVEGGGPGSSVWTVDDTGGTSNGLPSGGSCDGSSGMTVVDAMLDPEYATGIGAQLDAYDNGQTVFIDGVQFAPSQLRVGSRTVLGGPESMSGLDVRVEYGVAIASATMRTLVGLTNPGGDDVEVTVDHVTNVGTNAATQIARTSSGDAAFNVFDRWVITRDMDVPPEKPVVTHVFRGPADPGVLPLASAVSQTVFDCAGTQGIRVTFDVTVPAGETRYLLFFNQLSQTDSEAIAFAQAEFNSNPPVGGDLLFGLLPEQLAEVINWDFSAECRGADKLKLLLKADGGVLKYKSAKGDETSTADFSDPTDGTPYELCVIDLDGGVPELVECFQLAPGLGWKAKGNGFQYKDKDGSQDGLTRLLLRRGAQGKTKIVARGKEMSLPALPLSQDPAVVVLLANDRGLCWVGRFDDPAKVNTAEKFKAKQRNKPTAQDEGDGG